MPTYRFSCEECALYWDKERPMSESDKGSMCPKCKKKGLRDYGWAHTHFEGYDFTTNQNSIKDFYAGDDEGRAKEFYKEASVETKDRVEKSSPYSAMRPNLKAFNDSGMIKVLNDKETRNKKERARKMAQFVYDKHGVDPKKPSSGQNL